MFLLSLLCLEGVNTQQAGYEQSKLDAQGLFAGKQSTSAETSHHNPLAYVGPGTYQEARYEKLHTVIVENQQIGSKAIAREISDIIREKQRKGEKCILGLATGASPLKVYAELIKLHKEEGLSFKNVITFNLDEYYPMTKENDQSYWYFMHTNLFNHIDIDPKNVHIPDGTVKRDGVYAFCEDYDRQIRELGGLDFQLLGIGRTGHVGFNEPGSGLKSSTRMVKLNQLTRSDAAPAFKGIQNVPTEAITMGIGTIMGAKRIVLMAWGQSKAPIIKKAVEGEITSDIPATFLQNHNNCTIVIDNAASEQLSRFTIPWTVKEVQWNDEDLKAKAIVWLAEKLHKTILSLTEEDYVNNGLGGILAGQNVNKVNQDLYKRLSNTLTSHPGGEKKKKILIFSPHPDDDVISMGGTFDRLVQQGHEVHVAYQTSGNYAVADSEVVKFLEVYIEGKFSKNLKEVEELLKKLKNKKPGQIDEPEVRRMKTLIRKYESIGATRYFNVPDERVHHLLLPFYETGGEKKNPIGEPDFKIIMDLIKAAKPDEIYAAGDLADPHGTHKVCLDGIFESLKRLKNEPFMKDTTLWLYRGAWLEFDMEEIEMAIPMTQEDVMRKRWAIFYHQTQKDGAPFLGNDPREFWQRAEARNRQTALRYRNLGLAEYQAIEAFRRYDYRQ